MAAALAAGGCGDRAHARPAGEAGIDAPAPSTERLLAAARAEERARRYDRARALYQRAAREAPDRASAARAWRALARALLFWGDLVAGEEALLRAVALAPGDASAWHDLGVVQNKRGDPARAERALRRAVALAPRDPRPRVALGALLVVQRRWRDALAEYRALERLPLPDHMRRAVARAIALLEAEDGRSPAAPH
jgi:Flp pilus assembly protein TadD